jgi:hypothetical protein
MMVHSRNNQSFSSEVLCGGLFWRVTNDLSGVQNRLGCLFFACALLAFGSMSALEVCVFQVGSTCSPPLIRLFINIPSFSILFPKLLASERLIFIRERANGYYSPSAYFVQKVCLIRDVMDLTRPM